MAGNVLSVYSLTNDPIISYYIWHGKGNVTVYLASLVIPPFSNL